MKFGTQIFGIMAHLGTKLGWNTVNTCKVMCDYSQKITPICCHTHRINHRWHEAENWYRGGLTIEPQTLKEIKLNIMKTMIPKKPTVYNNNAIKNY